MKSSAWLLILMFTFCFVTGVTAEDKRVRLTLPPEQIPDPAWRRVYFEGTLPLKNRPRIISRKKVQDEIHVVVKNTGNTTLVYRSAGPDSFRHTRRYSDGGSGEKQTGTGVVRGRLITPFCPVNRFN